MACGRPRELREATGQWVVPLRGERFRELQAAARSLPSVRDAVLQGRTVRVSLPEGGDPSGLLASLEAQGFAFTAQAPERPSLEDLFVDLVRQDRGVA